MMRFYTKQHQFYCGVDLHTRVMYPCVLDATGQIVEHRNIVARPEPFLKLIAPFRTDLVVGVECTLGWYWLADLCRREGIEFVIGHALYMKAIHGGKAKNDKIDSHKIAAILRGGTFPLAYVYPPGMRETRDLLRRRTYLVRIRGEALAHIQNMASQYNLPPFPKKISYKANRTGVAAAFTDQSVRRNVAADLGLIEHLDGEIHDLEQYLVEHARVDDVQAYGRLQTAPGIGKILGLVLLYEIHTIKRFASCGEFLSYSRLVKCDRESAGQKYGFGGAKIGNGHLKWAFAEAVCLMLRDSEEVKRRCDRLEKRHGKATALAILRRRLGRAVYHMLRRREVFDMKKFLGQ
jgi:transposase